MKNDFQGRKLNCVWQAQKIFYFGTIFAPGCTRSLIP
jgi:hypothetical protein